MTQMNKLLAAFAQLLLALRNHSQDLPDDIWMACDRVRMALEDLTGEDIGPPPPSGVCDLQITGLFGKPLQCVLPMGHGMPHKDASGTQWEPK